MKVEQNILKVVTPTQQIKTILKKNFIQYTRGYYFIPEFALLILWGVQILANILPDQFSAVMQQTNEDRGIVCATQFMYLVLCCSRLGVFTFMNDREQYLSYQAALGIKIQYYAIAWFISKMAVAVVQLIFVLAITVGIMVGLDFSQYMQPHGLQNLLFLNSISYLGAIALSLAFSVLFTNASYMIQGMTLLVLVNNSNTFFMLSPIRATYNNTVNLFDFNNPEVPNLFLDDVPLDYVVVACQFIIYSLLYYIGMILRFKGSLILLSFRQKIINIVNSFRQSNKHQHLIPNQRRNQNISMDSNNLVLLVENICLRKVNQIVLLNFSLQVYRNECVCLFGKNGSGKSSLIKILSNVMEPTSGKSTNLIQNSTIGLCLQENYLYEDLSVEEQLHFYGGVKGIDDLSAAVQEIINTCELYSQKKKKYNELSGGNQRKLSLACALIGSPQILFLDEPTIGLDTKSKQKIWKMIQQQKRSNTTIILATSDLEQINALADKIVFLEKGTVIEVLSLEQMNKRNQLIHLQVHFLPSQALITCKSTFMSIIRQELYKDRILRQNQFIQSIQLVFHIKSIQIVNRLIRVSLEKIKDCQISFSMLKISQCSLLQNEEEMSEDEMIFGSLKEVVGGQSKVSFGSCVQAEFIKKYRTTIYSPQSILILLAIIGVYFCYPITLKMQQFYEYKTLIESCTSAQTFYCELLYGHYLFYQITDVDQLFSMLLYLYFFTICCNMVENKEKKFKYISDTIGMKHSSYILANFMFDWLLLFMVYMAAMICTLLICAFLGKVQNMFIYSMGYFCLICSFQILSFIAISYLLSLFYDKTYVAVSSVSFVLWFTALTLYDLEEGLIASELSMNILSYFSFNQTTSLLLETPQIFGRYFPFVKEYFQVIGQIYIFTESSFWFYIGGFCFQTFLWLLIMFSIELCIFKYKTFSKNINIFEIKHLESEDLLQEKYALMNLKESQRLSVSKLYKKYTNGFISVKDINLLIQQGQILGLIGPNGSGKSSTFSLITTEINKTTGKIVYQNMNTNQYFCNSIFENIGICPQFDYLYDRITVENHLLFISRLKGIKKMNRSLIINLFCKYFQMQSCYHKKISMLSNGERKKLIIISSFLGNPKIIFFDEPTVGLDLISRKKFYQLILYLSKQCKTSFIITTHNMIEAQQYCKRVGILVKGQLINLKSPSFIIKENSRGYKLRIICINGENMNKARTLIEKHIKIHQQHQNIHRLELIFNFPKEFFNFIDTYEFVYHNLYIKCLIVKFELKRQSLEEVASHIVNLDRKNEKQATEMYDLSEDNEKM